MSRLQLLRAAWQNHPTLAGLPTHAGTTLGYLRWQIEAWAISQGSLALLEKPRASMPFRQEAPAALSGPSICCGLSTEPAPSSPRSVAPAGPGTPLSPGWPCVDSTL